MNEVAVARIWKAADLFTTNVEGVSTNLVLPFLNIRFKKQSANENNTEFAGSGIYAILFRERVVYIGSFCPKAELGGGDIRSIRWSRHLETVSFRGCHVSIGQGPLQELLSHPKVASHATAIHLASPPEMLHRDRGHVTGVNRASFAIANWDVFGCPEGNVLENLEFYYIRDTNPPATEDPYRSRIKQIEDKLIKEFTPPCNSAMPTALDGNLGHPKSNVLKRMLDRFREALATYS